MRLRIPAIFLAIFGILLSTVVPAEAETTGDLPIGVMATFSGDFAPFGELVRSGIKSGSGPGVRFVYEDEGCLPAKAVSAFNKLLTIDRIGLFIGPVCGSSQQAVAPLLKARDAVALFPTSSPRKLFAESGERAFSSQFSIERESAFNARAMFALGARRTVLIATASDFASAHEAAFRENYRGEILDSITFPKIDREAIRAAALRISKLAPDSIYVPDATPFFYGLKTQLNQTGLSAIKVFSVYSAQSKDMLAAEGEAANGLMYSYPDIGTENAFDYYPRIASKLLSEAAVACKGTPECVATRLKKSGSFDEFGTLQGEIELRTVRNGKFGFSLPVP